MARFKIKGNKKLKGKIRIMGSKNAAVALISASLLTDQRCTLTNVPKIDDVEILVEMIKKLGAEAKWIDESTLCLETKKIKKTKLDDNLVRKLRASILLLGPLMARKGRAEMIHPGGCFIGTRPVGTHFDALRNLGAKITQDDTCYHLKAEIIKGAKFYLPEQSVTATENAIMAAILAPGKTTIINATSERHVVALSSFLNKMGAKIKGAGTSTVEIEGVEKLSGANFEIIDDELEVGSFIALSLASNSEIELSGHNFSGLEPITHKAEQFGAKIKISKERLKIGRLKNIKANRIQCAPWPGFPTDLIPQFAVAATQAQGMSLIHEWMYERRLSYVDELIKMGAKITLCDPHRALVEGPSKLFGTKIISPDIRAGMALLIAGLIAEGETEIGNIELIERGYYKIEERLKKIGAEIQRIE